MFNEHCVCVSLCDDGVENALGGYWRGLCLNVQVQSRVRCEVCAASKANYGHKSPADGVIKRDQARTNAG